MCPSNCCLKNRHSISNILQSLAQPVSNERGTVLVISIMILALLTFLGIAALDTTSTEIRISANDRVYKQAFYAADTGISYAVQSNISLFGNSPSWTAVATPGLVTAGINATLEYQVDSTTGSLKMVQVRSTGTAPGNGRAVIIAGLMGIMVGAAPNLTEY